MKNSLKTFNTCRSAAGFTLTELLIGASIMSFVVGAAGFGIVNITGLNRRAEAETQRRIELNRALDFIADEIRMARRVNTTNSTTTTASAAVTAANTATTFINSLGNTGTIVLYLEIPITDTIPVTCPSGGPNAGSPPPQPSTYDRVVYDIRTNTSTWKGPRVINRYGRLLRSNGTINPCSNPVASEALIDSVSNTGTAPTCTSPASISGAGGFYACANGRRVDLYLNSKLTYANSTTDDTYSVNSSVFVRGTP